MNYTEQVATLTNDRDQAAAQGMPLLAAQLDRQLADLAIFHLGS